MFFPPKRTSSSRSVSNLPPPITESIPIQLYSQFCKWFVQTSDKEFHTQLNHHFKSPSTLEPLVISLLHPFSDFSQENKRLALQNSVNSSNPQKFAKECRKLFLHSALEIWYSFEHQFEYVSYKKPDYDNFTLFPSKYPSSKQSRASHMTRNQQIQNQIQAIQKLAEFSALCTVQYLFNEATHLNNHPHKALLDSQLVNQILFKHRAQFQDVQLVMNWPNSKKSKLKNVAHFFQFPIPGYSTENSVDVTANVKLSTKSICLKENDLPPNTTLSLHYLRRPFDFEWLEFDGAAENHRQPDRRSGVDFFVWTERRTEVRLVYSDLVKDPDFQKWDGAIFQKYAQALPSLKETLKVLYKIQKKLDSQNGNERRAATKEERDFLRNQHSAAAMLERQGKYEDAMGMYEGIYEFETRVLGTPNPQALATRINIAAMMDCQGRYEEALALYRAVWEVQKEVIGLEHPDTLTTQNNMAFVLQNQGKFEEAMELYQNVYSIEKDKLGLHHPDSLTTQNNIASALRCQGKYDEAFKLFRQVYQSRIRSLGLKNPQTFTSRNNMASVLADQGKYEEALEMYRNVYDMSRDILGYDHPTTLTTRQSMAIVMKKQGRMVEALDTMTGVWERSRRVLGDNHSMTVSARIFMDSFLCV